MAYKGHALKLGNTWIGGTLQQTFENQTQMLTEPTAGSPYPLQTSIANIKAGFRFRSANVAAALGSLGFLGLVLGGGTSAELYEIQYDDNGFITAGTTHRKVAIANGRAIWRTISCQNGQDAEIEIMVMGLSSNGLTSSVAFTESIAAPTPVDAARHTLYNAKLADIAMGCLLNLQIDSGMQIESAACSSNVFDTRIDLKSIVPKIRVTTLATQLVGSGSGKINVSGAAATHANTLVQLRKRVTGTGTFVADATAEHISFTAAGMVVPTSGFESQRNEDGQSTFELTATFDGTNLPYVINAATALA